MITTILVSVVLISAAVFIVGWRGGFTEGEQQGYRDGYEQGRPEWHTPERARAARAAAAARQHHVLPRCDR